MMAHKSTIISAIDIGTTKIVAIIGRKTDSGKFEVLGLGKHVSKGIRRGEVLNIDETVKSIQAAVKEAEAKAAMKMTDVYVGMAGAHIHSQRTSGYVQLGVDEDEIAAAHTQDLINQIRNTSVEMGEEIMHVIPQGYIVDHMQGVGNPVGVAGKRLEGNFHVVIGKVSAANNIKKCVTRVGLNVKELILEPLASARAVLSADELEAGVAMIDIGGGTTDIAIYRDNQIIHTAVIPIGGHTITTDIKKGCKIVERIAERLKKEYGKAMPLKGDQNKVVKIPGINGSDYLEISFNNLAGIIHARMEEIIEHALYHIDSYGLRSDLAAGIVVTGGGASLKNLTQLVSVKTGLMTRVGKPRVAVSGEAAGSINDPALSTAIGLMMLGASDMDDNSEATSESDNVLTIDSGSDCVEGEEKPDNKDKAVNEQGTGAKKLSNKVNDLFSKFFDMGDTNM